MGLTCCEVENGGTELDEGIGGLEEERLRRCPVSGGVDRERERVLGSRRSGLGPLCCDSWEKTGWLSTCGGVAGGVECPEATERKEILTC